MCVRATLCDNLSLSFKAELQPMYKVFHKTVIAMHRKRRW